MRSFGKRPARRGDGRETVLRKGMLSAPLVHHEGAGGLSNIAVTAMALCAGRAFVPEPGSEKSLRF